MKNNAYLFLALAGLLLGSCEMKQEILNKKPEPTNEGILRIDGITPEAEPQPVPVTAAAAAPPVKTGEVSANVDDFGVDIIPVGSDIPVKEFASYRELKESGLSVVLPAGDYMLMAHSDDEEFSASWERPYFIGREPFTIEPGIITEVNMTCYMQSVKVQIVLSPEFLASFRDDYAVTVTNGESVLIFDSQTPLTGYFKATSTLRMTICATTTEGNEVRYRTTLAGPDGTIKPKDFFLVNLNIDVADVTVGKEGMITVDTELIQEEVTITVPTPNEEPTPTPPTGDGPTIEGDGFDIAEAVTFTQAEASTVQVRVNIGAASGIANLKVRIDSPYLTPDVLGMFGIPLEFDMANLDADLAANFDAIGLPTTGIKGETSVVFDVSAFMSLLNVNTHMFHLTVVEADGGTTEATLTVTMTN